MLMLIKDVWTVGDCQQVLWLPAYSTQQLNVKSYKVGDNHQILWLSPYAKQLLNV